jgi:hypothetical protein
VKLLTFENLKQHFRKASHVKLERGAWFISSAHSDEVIDQTIATVRDAARGLGS